MSELTPETRKEIFYKAILDRDASDLPDPETREELWLKQIAEGGSGSVLYSKAARISGIDDDYTFTCYSHFISRDPDEEIVNFIQSNFLPDVNFYEVCGVYTDIANTKTYNIMGIAGDADDSDVFHLQLFDSTGTVSTVAVHVSSYLTTSIEI